jgi:hypothetical protein
MAIWYIFPDFGMFYQGKSGNNDLKTQNVGKLKAV